MRKFIVFICAILVCGCEKRPLSENVSVSRIGDKVVIENNLVRIEYGLSSGLWSAFKRGGDAVVRDALSLVEPQEYFYVPSVNEKDAWSYTSSDVEDNLGKGKSIIFKPSSSPAALVPSLIFKAYDGKGFFTVSQAISNLSGSSITLMTMYPIATSANGGLYIGQRLSTHRILDNGSSVFPEIYINIIPGNKSSGAVWNQAIYDLESHKSLISGFLNFERGMPIIFVKPLSGKSPDGREGWSFSTSVSLAPGKTIPQGGTLTSETFYIDFTVPDPLNGLENYARNIARFLGKSPWKGRVPSGWNSWGGGGSGGYGHDIDEDLMLVNLDFMAVNFKPFGQEYFQVDDGWQVSVGDWATNTTRFFHGMKWLAEQISSRGFLPGLWIAPFDVETSFSSPTTIYQVNEKWSIPSDAIGVPCNRALDTSDPEALEWAGQIFSIVSQEWGYKWIKLDFGYCALLSQYMNPLGSKQNDMNLTFAEAYRQGQRAARKAMGDNTFFLQVAVTGLNYDIVDGMRISLDNMPWWEAEDPKYAWAKGPENILCYPAGNACFSQGIKPTVRSVTRRYYLHERVWINHPDMIFFRPPVTQSEALSFASLVAMSGGVVKLGERVSEMTSFGVDVYRKLLPVYGKSGRPVDLFLRELPEVWDLRVKGSFESWDIVGLFNWGTNMDLTKNPYEIIPEGPRNISVDITSLGLDPGTDYLAYEFWTGKFLGTIRGKLALFLKPRTVSLIALREKTGRPQLLGTNRHFTMGGEDIESVEWDEESLELTISLTANTGTMWKGKEFPFEHRLAFYIPDSYTLTAIASDPPSSAQVEEESRNLLRLVLNTTQSQRVSLTLRFTR